MTVGGEPPPWSPARSSGAARASRSTGLGSDSATSTTATAPSNEAVVHAPLLEVDPPQLQTRVSVLLRLLFTLPVAVVVSLWSVVAMLAQMLGWFAALVTGRLPTWVWQLQTGHLRVAARAGGYLMMLTDLYPSYDHCPDPDYPIRLVLGQPGRLNRAAVLFRAVLAIPALLLAYLAMAGWLLASPVGWIWILSTGRAPATYWQACTAVLRWVLRYLAWSSMVTARYPRALYGDRDRARDGLPGTPGGAGTLRLSKAADVVLSVFLLLGGVAATYIGLADAHPAAKAIGPAQSLQLLEPLRAHKSPLMSTPPPRAPRPHRVLRPPRTPPPRQLPHPAIAPPEQQISTQVPAHDPGRTDSGTSKNHGSHRGHKRAR